MSSWKANSGTMAAGVVFGTSMWVLGVERQGIRRWIEVVDIATKRG
jgi:hypothetical protein